MSEVRWGGKTTKRSTVLGTEEAKGREAKDDLQGFEEEDGEATREIDRILENTG